MSGSWVYDELLTQTQYTDTLLPVNFIMLAVISGIIGLVVGAFTAWHILLASRGQTTIECLEKTRYLSPLRKSMQNQFIAQHNGDGVPLPRYGQQLLDMHANALPGVTRPEEGEIRTARDDDDDDMPSQLSYEEMERYRARKRYEEYLDEQDSEKLPNAFDLGAKRNLLHLFGPKPALWFFPVANTTGDGWNWEASPKWIAARDRIAREREEQRQRERAAGWGEPEPLAEPITTERPPNGASRHYRASPPPARGGRKTPSKADRVLGRDPNLYADEPPHSVSLQTLDKHGHDIEAEFGHDAGRSRSSRGGSRSSRSSSSEDDDDDAETQALNLVTNGGWAKSGASGLLRKPSRSSGGRPSPPRNFSRHDEDEVD